MKFLALVVLILYGFFLAYIFLYSLIQLSLVRHYRRQKNKPAELKAWPVVTIQLPIYNERYVAERLIDSVAEMDYPRELLEIQVLDDSTDDTTAIISKRVEYWKGFGLAISHIHRSNRQGFKAGALANGLKLAKGEFVAVFDADFLPKPYFLKRTLGYFENPEIGMVQTRWTHINEGYNLLTRLQAFGLNAHFTVEQGGRNSGGHFINFNGTAGIWRAETIQDAGGWQSDTLTEDLDLSYRAQTKGWNFVFLEDVDSPAELPVAINALKTQQFRWNKGAAQCTRKNLWPLLTKKGVKWSTKIHGLFHLMNSFLFICVLAIGLLSFPLLWVKVNFPEFANYFHFGLGFVASFVFLAYFYWNSFNEGGFFKFIGKFLLFLSYALGLSLHNALAVAEGYMGRQTPFNRTPKFNVTKKRSGVISNVYMNWKLKPLFFAEVVLVGYFILAAVYGILNAEYGQLLFHAMLIVGFAGIAFYSLKQRFYSTTKV